MTTMQRFSRWLTLERLLGILAIIAIFTMAARAPLDTDMLWHLRAGEWQVEQRALLRVDVFSTTRAGEPWINHSWLSQLILFGAYSAFSDPGLTLYTALLAAGGMAFVYLTLDESNAVVRAFVLVLAGATAAVFWAPRPHMISFTLSAVVFYLLWEFLEHGKDRLWLIPVLMVFWVNLHGGYAIGFVLMVLALVGEVLRFVFKEILPGRLGEDRPLRQAAQPLVRIVTIGLVSAATLSLNPYGPQMVIYPFRTVGIGVLQDFINEWAAPDFHQPHTWPFIWLLLGTLAAVGLSPRRLGWRNAVLLSGTAYASLLAGRNFPTFAIVAAPVLGRHLDAWLMEQGVSLNLKYRPVGIQAWLNWLLLLIVIVAAGAKFAYATNRNLIAEARASALPVDAVEYMLSEDVPNPVFNSYNWGGYLIWSAPEFPVYVDGRTDLYDDELLNRYLNTLFGGESWEIHLDDEGVNTVLIEENAPLASLLAQSEKWEIRYDDPIAVVYVRKEPIP